CVSYWRAIYLHYHVARLNAQLLLDSVAHSCHERALPALQLVLRSNRGSKRDQLELAQHGHARGVDVRQVDDLNSHRHKASATFDRQRVIFSNAQLEELG